MEHANLLIAAMAETCRDKIRESENADPGLVRELQPEHLLWMCDRIEQHAEDWPASKLHRWVGFVQCGMMANRIVDLAEAKTMFNEAKKAYGTAGDDEDLRGHLDSASDFEMEMGGEG